MAVPNQPPDFPASKPIDSERPSFLSLPAEIRNRIYELALTRARNLRISTVLDNPTGCHLQNRAICCKFSSGIKLNNTRVFPSILRLCKQTHKEATPILYGSNTFDIVDIATLQTFINSIGTSIKHIRNIALLKLYLGHSYVDWNALTEATALQKIIVRDCDADAADRLAFLLHPLHMAYKQDSEAKQVWNLLEVEGTESVEFIKELRSVMAEMESDPVKAATRRGRGYQKND